MIEKSTLQAKGEYKSKLLSGIFSGLVALFCFLITSVASHAAGLHALSDFDSSSLQIVVSGGVIVAAFIVCLGIFNRFSSKKLIEENNNQIDYLQKIDNYELLLTHSGQCAVIWKTPVALPEIIGHMVALDKA